MAAELLSQLGQEIEIGGLRHMWILPSREFSLGLQGDLVQQYGEPNAQFYPTLLLSTLGLDAPASVRRCQIVMSPRANMAAMGEKAFPPEESLLSVVPIPSAMAFTDMESGIYGTIVLSRRLPKQTSFREWSKQANDFLRGANAQLKRTGLSLYPESIPTFEPLL